MQISIEQIKTTSKTKIRKNREHSNFFSYLCSLKNANSGMIFQFGHGYRLNYVASAALLTSLRTPPPPMYCAENQ